MAALQVHMRKPILLILFISFPVFGWDNLESDYAKLATSARHIWSGGSWQHEYQEGFFRFLVAGGGYEHYKTKLYVQWILHGSDMEDPKVLSTIEISELNEDPIYAFSLPICVGGSECQNIELEATHTYALSEHLFSIKFTAVGKYELTQKNL